MKLYISLVLVILATIVLLGANKVVEKWDSRFSANTYVDFQIKYQVILLLTALAVLFTTWWLNPESFRQYFSVGNINAATQELPLFGIKRGDQWLETGLSLSVIITLVTGIFMYFQIRQQPVDWSLLIPGLGWIVLFSLTNSFGEEVIYRLGVVSPLHGLITPGVIFLISAVLFGIPHFAGMPSGVIGVILAGVLGYVLAKSVYETNGIFWAWVIHFLQDVVIIGAIYLMKTKA